MGKVKVEKPVHPLIYEPLPIVCILFGLICLPLSAFSVSILVLSTILIAYGSYMLSTRLMHRGRWRFS